MAKLVICASGYARPIASASTIGSPRWAATMKGWKELLPPISVAITAGRHSLRLEADGKPPLEQTVDVQLSDGETVNKFFQLPD